MSDTTYLDWPFFEPRHAGLARALDAWATEIIPHGHGPDVDAECKALVKSLGQAGWRSQKESRVNTPGGDDRCV